MSNRVLIVGVNGQPLVTETDGTDMLAGLLVECFGALLGLQQGGEWMHAKEGPQGMQTKLLTAISNAVGAARIEARFKGYGLTITKNQPAEAEPQTGEAQS